MLNKNDLNGTGKENELLTFENGSDVNVLDNK